MTYTCLLCYYAFIHRYMEILNNIWRYELMIKFGNSKKLIISAAIILSTTPFCSGICESNAKINSNVNSSYSQSEKFEIDQNGVLESYKGDKTEVTIPENVKTIAFGAFMGNKKIEKVNLPEGLKNIEKLAFSDCVSLKEITIPDSVTKISVLAFSDCKNLEKIYIGKNLDNLKRMCINGCDNLKSIMVSDENDFLASYDGILYSKDFSSLKICPMYTKGEVKLHDNTSLISDYAFFDCKNVTGVSKISDKIIDIEEMAFAGCSKLKSLNFTDDIGKIGSCAFSKCTALEEFNIGKQVKKIGSSAFLGCTNLKKLFVEAKKLKLGHGIFNSCPQNILIHTDSNSSFYSYFLKHINQFSLIK